MTRNNPIQAGENGRMVIKNDQEETISIKPTRLMITMLKTPQANKVTALGRLVVALAGGSKR